TVERRQMLVNVADRRTRLLVRGFQVRVDPAHSFPFPARGSSTRVAAPGGTALMRVRPCGDRKRAPGQTASRSAHFLRAERGHLGTRAPGLLGRNVSQEEKYREPALPRGGAPRWPGRTACTRPGPCGGERRPGRCAGWFASAGLDRARAAG